MRTLITQATKGNRTVKVWYDPVLGGYIAALYYKGRPVPVKTTLYRHDPEGKEKAIAKAVELLIPFSERK